ncbi:MAG: DNA-processing protein DprA [Bacteroidales bacterium]|nr:DNA-processing protein DprA [Bacteroidales bacterium]
MSADLVYKIAFASVRGMGVDLAQKLLEVLDDEKDFFSIPERELRAITHSRSKILERAYRNSCIEMAEKEMEFINQHHINVSYFTDESYPQRLLHAPDAPILLYSVGHTDLNSKHIVSIVGTRRCSEYGKHMCERIVKELAESIPDVVTVSGLALGIDIAAHNASLKHGVPTLAVQACGLNKIYPAEHRNAAEKIVKNGGRIISDYTSQDVLHRGNFVARNRIIAALSDCTIVIESAEKGGSLITANLAQSYNRDVFGRAGDEFSKGCNQLIKRNQAMLVTSATDIVEALRWDSCLTNKPTQQLDLFPTLTPEEQAVVDVIQQAGDIHINAITEKLNIPVYRVMSTLMQLDFKGVIITMPGCRYAMA